MDNLLLEKKRINDEFAKEKQKGEEIEQEIARLQKLKGDTLVEIARLQGEDRLISKMIKDADKKEEPVVPQGEEVKK